MEALRLLHMAAVLPDGPPQDASCVTEHPVADPCRLDRLRMPDIEQCRNIVPKSTKSTKSTTGPHKPATPPGRRPRPEEKDDPLDVDSSFDKLLTWLNDYPVPAPAEQAQPPEDANEVATGHDDLSLGEEDDYEEEEEEQSSDPASEPTLPASEPTASEPTEVQRLKTWIAGGPGPLRFKWVGCCFSGVLSPLTPMTRCYGSGMQPTEPVQPVTGSQAQQHIRGAGVHQLSHVDCIQVPGGSGDGDCVGPAHQALLL